MIRKRVTFDIENPSQCPFRNKTTRYYLDLPYYDTEYTCGITSEPCCDADVFDEECPLEEVKE